MQTTERRGWRRIAPSSPREARMLDRTDPGWSRAWAALADTWGAARQHTDDADGCPACQTCECCGEGWQYMGTYRDVATGQGAHEFRHRHHPATGQRADDRVPMVPGDFPDDTATGS